MYIMKPSLAFCKFSFNKSWRGSMCAPFGEKEYAMIMYDYGRKVWFQSCKRKHKYRRGWWSNVFSVHAAELRNMRPQKPWKLDKRMEHLGREAKSFRGEMWSHGRNEKWQNNGMFGNQTEDSLRSAIRNQWTSKHTENWLENSGIEPETSCMLSTRSTNWANPPIIPIPACIPVTTLLI